MSKPAIPAPVPTDYCGVRFRSKSEAIFAHSLTLSKVLWEYEPDQWRTTDGWGPDFRTTWKSEDQKIVDSLIEYKPDMVTNAYLNIMVRRIHALKPLMHSLMFCFVVCGSPWNTTRKVIQVSPSMKCIDVSQTVKFLTSNITKASKYRFDLKH